MRGWLAIVAMVALFNCAASGAPRERDTITMKVLPSGLCLYCATYTIILEADGRGIFIGERGAAAQGKHRFRATLDQVRAFSDRLRTYRPRGEVLMDRPPLCGPLATDQNWVEVRWQTPSGSHARLSFYGGCDMEKNRAMAEALFSAPDLLPVKGLIGKR